MKRIYLTIVAGLLFSTQVITAQDNKTQNTDRYFEINKNIEIFNAIVKELDMFYVDTLNVEKTIQTGIVNMLSSLDPYTNYIPESEMADFKFVTTGEYAGIGSYVTARKLGDAYKIIITSPYEGMPAAKAGLKDGDIILSIDDEDMTTLNNAPVTEASKAGELSSTVSGKLKGQPGTIVKIKVQRNNSAKPIEFKIQREHIQISPVPYYGVLNNGQTGYMSFTSFTDKGVQDVKKSFFELKKEGITSLIIDLRGNGGGILEEAVQLVNLFAPKGQVVVSTKGKLKQLDRTYRTTLQPIDTEIPLVILIDRGSASASEIVSGAFQDLDRAVLIGDRTFGKGLVQSPRELPYDGSIKITTSKYYIPSGRCIQAIDYGHRNEDGSVARIPDSLTNVFKTAMGREVRDGGGISPDIKIEEDKTPTLLYYLSNQFVIFDYATQWAAKHDKIAPAAQFSITDEDYNQFKEFVKARKDFKYDMLSEKTLKSLKEVMEYEGYMNSANDEYKALEAKLSPSLDRDLEISKDKIMELLNSEIAKRYYYNKGEIIQGLKNDKAIKEAVDLLNDMPRYKEILSPKNKAEETEKQTNK